MEWWKCVVKGDAEINTSKVRGTISCRENVLRYRHNASTHVAHAGHAIRCRTAGFGTFKRLLRSSVGVCRLLILGVWMFCVLA